MFNRASPIGSDYKKGAFGNLSRGPSVCLSETHFGFLGELATFDHAASTVDKLVQDTAARIDGSSAFKIAHNRWFLTGTEALQHELKAKVKPEDASLVDLTHGRTSLIIVGQKAEWVLSKLYPIDFSPTVFRVETGLSTTHHNIFTQIYRSDENTFNLFIFRSFARSFWHTLTRASEDNGYKVE
jgi:methylglutamate dehydrogenase subunit D